MSLPSSLRAGPEGIAKAIDQLQFLPQSLHVHRLVRQVSVAEQRRLRAALAERQRKAQSTRSVFQSFNC